MEVNIEPSWKALLAPEFEKPYFRSLVQYIHREYASGQCFPPGSLIFNAFSQTPFPKVKVVILGQDPYHEPGQAHGLCFSVQDGVPFPPSLRNIFQEIESETGAPIPQSGNLTRWARQGVFLLNTCLTVRAHQAFSHANQGWEQFTNAVISLLNARKEGLVFLLWGSPAGQKASLIDASRHCVLRSAHPSPLSAFRGFFGNNHFKLCNEYLTSHGQEPIEW
ncbi:MAG: uracil-DNA glycosylase [Prevotellaceae bacterium]|nr:uracil-DNA glycosylase [Prevotellaceae bacterium]